MDECEIAAGTTRVEKITWNGAPAWVKRPERLSRRMRLQKGNPKRAFEADLAAHRRFAAEGAPVPRVLAKGPGYFVVEDAGPTIAELVREGELDGAALDTALEAAVRALARLHAAGLAHGRPIPRDICWRDDRIAFIDLERAAGAEPAMDVLVFFFGVIVELGADHEQLARLAAAYRAEDRKGNWERACARAARYRLLSPLLRLVARALPENREWGAVGPFLDFFGDPPRA